MDGDKIIRLRKELKEANRQFDRGDLTKEELKTILYEVYLEYKETAEKITANDDLLQELIPLSALSLI